MSKPAYIQQLEASPCECVACPDCVNGQVWVTIDGEYHKHRCDDLGDTETCFSCEGSGLREDICNRCAELIDYGREQEDAHA